MPGLQDRLAFRTCPNVNCLHHFCNENLTVAMTPGARAFPDRLDDPLRLLIPAYTSFVSLTFVILSFLVSNR